MYLYNEMIKYKASKIIITVKRQHTLQMVAVCWQWKRKNKKIKKNCATERGHSPFKAKVLVY
jgi:hypothetical protein